MNLRLLIFIPLALLQFSVPGWMIFHEEQTLQHGRLFKFRTAPVDPYDALRGRYVALRFDAENNSVIKAAPWPDDQKVWVQLETDPQGFAKVKQVSTTPLRGDDVMEAHSRWGGLQFPFDRYYLDEKIAPKAEAAYRANNTRNHENAYVTVRILDGHAALEDLYIDDKPIREFLRTDAGK